MYSLNNNGRLDDLTSYSDEDFNHVYYPECSEMRDMYEQHGDFVGEQMDVYTLDAKELNNINLYGCLIQTYSTVFKDYVPMYMTGKGEKKSLKDVMDKPTEDKSEAKRFVCMYI